MVKGAIIRKHIGHLNPELAVAINNPAYRQTNPEMAAKGHDQTGGDTVSNEMSENIIRYLGEEKKGLKHEEVTREANQKDQDLEKFQKALKKRRKWEKNNVKI